MKTVYFSDVLNKQFDTEEACKEAEAAYAKIQAEKEAKKTALAAKEEEFKEALKEADQEVSDAIDGLTDAKKKIDEITKETMAKIKEIKDAANERVDSAKKVREEILLDYTKTFGKPYVRTEHYEGKEALDAYRRYMKEVRDLSKFFWF